MIHKLIKIANKLDKLGQYDLANMIDNIIFAGYDTPWNIPQNPTKTSVITETQDFENHFNKLKTLEEKENFLEDLEATLEEDDLIGRPVPKGLNRWITEKYKQIISEQDRSYDSKIEETKNMVVDKLTEMFAEYYRQFGISTIEEIKDRVNSDVGSEVKHLLVRGKEPNDALVEVANKLYDELKEYASDEKEYKELQDIVRFEKEKPVVEYMDPTELEKKY